MRTSDRRVHPAWWTAILLVVITAISFTTVALFDDSFRSSVPVSVVSERSGIIMEPGGKVKLRGFQVGRVAAVVGGSKPVRLELEIDADQAKFIPANVQVQIRATTAFGAKFVDLIYPNDPSPQRISAGEVLHATNVTSEVNTVFESIVDLLHQIDPAKLNGILSALAEGVRGQGPAIGEATTDANTVLLALNPRSDTVRADWRSLAGFSDSYAAAAHNILTILDSASTTATTITEQSRALDALLLSTTGLATSGINLLGASKDNLVHTVDALQPTTSLLLKYNPIVTCLLQGGLWILDHGLRDSQGGNGASMSLDASILGGGADMYRYPVNLPITGAKGGPDGKPGCGSLPDPTKMFPVRALITNTGWGTGNDIRVNPGIGFPGWANYFPVTRGVPQPPSLRNQGGPAPGPTPYPGGPPYGALLYAPDGTPLYPGLPPAPPPGAPRDPGPTPGSEPFTAPAPAGLAPTPLPAPPPAEPPPPDSVPPS
jgi:phospholipid/cholesterol/gamma-HCH transport system substrate-binding protein